MYPYSFCVGNCVDLYSIFMNWLSKCVAPHPRQKCTVHLRPEGSISKFTFFAGVWGSPGSVRKLISVRVASAFGKSTTKSPEAPRTLPGHAPDTPRTCSQDPLHCPYYLLSFASCPCLSRNLPARPQDFPSFPLSSHKCPPNSLKCPSNVP